MTSKQLICLCDILPYHIHICAKLCYLLRPNYASAVRVGGLKIADWFADDCAVVTLMLDDSQHIHSLCHMATTNNPLFKRGYSRFGPHKKTGMRIFTGLARQIPGDAGELRRIN